MRTRLRVIRAGTRTRKPNWWIGVVISTVLFCSAMLVIIHVGFEFGPIGFYLLADPLGDWHATALGIALATMINLLNFPLYLLSGGVLGAWEFFAPAMIAECRKRSFTFRSTETRIEKAALGNEAGLYGAAYLPFL